MGKSKPYWLLLRLPCADILIFFEFSISLGRNSCPQKEFKFSARRNFKFSLKRNSLYPSEGVLVQKISHSPSEEHLNLSQRNFHSPLEGIFTLAEWSLRQKKFSFSLPKNFHSLAEWSLRQKEFSFSLRMNFHYLAKGFLSQKEFSFSPRRNFHSLAEWSLRQKEFPFSLRMIFH